MEYLRGGQECTAGAFLWARVASKRNIVFCFEGSVNAHTHTDISGEYTVNDKHG